jgi:hypothetical protein
MHGLRLEPTRVKQEDNLGAAAYCPCQSLSMRGTDRLYPSCSQSPMSCLGRLRRACVFPFPVRLDPMPPSFDRVRPGLMPLRGKIPELLLLWHPLDHLSPRNRACKSKESVMVVPKIVKLACVGSFQVGPASAGAGVSSTRYVSADKIARQLRCPPFCQCQKCFVRDRLSTDAGSGPTLRRRRVSLDAR